jgi:hypothetical protein
MIETLQDWNARLSGCGCCTMPECPEPQVVNEFKLAYVCGHRFPFYHPDITDEDKIRFFRTVTEAKRHDEDFSYPSSSGSPPKDTTVSILQTKNTEQITVKEKVSGQCVISRITKKNQIEYHYSETADNPEEWEEEDRPPFLYTVDISYEYLEVNGVVITNSGTQTVFLSEDPPAVVEPLILGFPVYNFLGLNLNSWDYEPGATRFTLDPESFGETPNELWSVEFSEEIDLADVDAEVDAEPWFPTSQVAIAERFNKLLYPTDLLYRKIRFRFRIPNTHLGSKFTITYDVAEFPEDEEVDPSFVSEDNVVEWVGFGDPEDPDGDSWLTDWIEIDPPEISGERRVVNIRYTCYSGDKFGVKPQVMGEAFEPPAP